MSLIKSLKLTFFSYLIFASAASAQWTPMPDINMPGIWKEFKPIVGSGVQYEELRRNKEAKTFGAASYVVSYAVVGKESVGGAVGYWLEVRSPARAIFPASVDKQLIVVTSKGAVVKRMISQ